MPDEIARNDSPPNLAHQVEHVTVTDEQRSKLYELITDDPWRGHTKAARMAGIAGTKGQVNDYLKADEDFNEFLDAARGNLLDKAGLGVPHLFKKLASVVNNDGHSSQLRAITDSLAFRGIGVRQTVQVEHTGANGAPIQVEDRSASLADVARVLEAVGALAELSSGSSRLALPAPPHILAEPLED